MKKIAKTHTLADQAFSIIKESILTGELGPGEALPEEKYSKQLGISRTPFRDTLLRLASEGLIIQKTGSPAVVADFTKIKSLEYMELRHLVEVYNIEKIVHKIDDETLKTLEENLSRQYHAISRNDYSDFMTLDKEFHLTLIKLNDNEEMRALAEKVNTGISRAFLILSKTVPQSAKEAYEEHTAVLDTLKKHDHIQAKNKMIVHLSNVEKRFLNYYKDHTNTKEDE
ncbi:GntR family transcriptional regulator [Corticicoccus populi]|uniref:GntR family transcriptional regulator n=1 Tax=Corticicoccus populi TaxID=1812821 RepID=A0ABW5WWC8_9STAP